ncbi:MAG: heme-binding protein [Kiritimatiellaeota bacterium]|nr:heme-binding protein [Kiritimatiellota bacterium]
MKIVLWLLLGAVLVTLAVVAGCATSRKGYESPAYTVVRSAGAVEIRDYPALIVAQTPLAGTGGRSQNGGFMNLFHYIAGENEGRKKLPMTTPVLVAPAAERSTADTNASMAFIMPEKYALTDLPRPAGTNVTLRRVEAARYAVRRFSGRRDAAAQARETEALVRWMMAQGYAPLGAPLYAFYDPPWTPGFLRRNEVLLRFQGSAPRPSE